jgi:prepilin peptidase CpaA
VRTNGGQEPCLRTGHIPNALTYSGLGLGAALHFSLLVSGRGEELSCTFVALACARVVAGIVLCGLVPLLLFLRNGMGGGDVKLLAALGAFLGPVTGLEVQLYAFVVVALLAPAHLAYQGRLLAVLRNALSLLRNPWLPPEQRRSVAPELMTWLKFGPAVALATAMVAWLRWRGA